jgi:hypothetical protein
MSVPYPASKNRISPTLLSSTRVWRASRAMSSPAKCYEGVCIVRHCKISSSLSLSLPPPSICPSLFFFFSLSLSLSLSESINLLLYLHVYASVSLHLFIPHRHILLRKPTPIPLPRRSQIPAHCRESMPRHLCKVCNPSSESKQPLRYQPTTVEEESLQRSRAHQSTSRQTPRLSGSSSLHRGRSRPRRAAARGGGLHQGTTHPRIARHAMRSSSRREVTLGMHCTRG